MLTMIVALFVSASLGLSGLVSTAEAQEPHRWRFYLYTPAPHPATRGLIQFAEEVKSRSGGRLEIKVSPAGELRYRLPQRQHP